MEMSSSMIRIDIVHANSAGLHGSAAAAGDLHPDSGASQNPAPVSPDGHSSTADQYSSTTTTSVSGVTSPAALPTESSGPDPGSTATSVTVIVDGTRPRAMALKSLKESVAHTMAHQQLQKSERQYQKDGSGHKRRLRRLSKELYVVVSWYAVLQGALFAAVAQTSIFTCADWWGPVCMAGLVTVGMLATALDKLGRMGEEQDHVRLFQVRQNAVYDKITELQWRGSDCKLDNLQPEHEDAPSSKPGLLCIASPQGILVLGFLVGFSALIIISCLSMLCKPHCKCPSQ